MVARRCAILRNRTVPGATDTEFFRRAGMTDTRVGTEKKDGAPCWPGSTGYGEVLGQYRSRSSRRAISSTMFGDLHWGQAVRRDEVR